MRAGDILLVRDYTGGSDLLGNLILAGERARYGNSDFACWTHSALVVSDDGGIVEALAQGIERTHADKYKDVQTLVISPSVPDEMRLFACRFAVAQIGTKYDVLDFVTLAATLLTGLMWSMHSDKRFICSGLVSRATECYTASGYQFPSEQMMPADLGSYWNALSGRPLPPLSLVGRLLDKFRVVCRSISPF